MNTPFPFFTDLYLRGLEIAIKNSLFFLSRQKPAEAAFPPRKGLQGLSNGNYRYRYRRRVFFVSG